MSSNVEIRIRGTLPADAAERLGMTASRAPAVTILRGPVADQPALHGVLAKIRDLGLCLISVHRRNDPASRDDQ